MEDVSTNNDESKQAGDEDFAGQQQRFEQFTNEATGARNMFVQSSNLNMDNRYIPQQQAHVDQQPLVEPTPIHPHGTNVYVLPNLSVFDDPQLLHATNNPSSNETWKLLVVPTCLPLHLLALGSSLLVETVSVK